MLVDDDLKKEKKKSPGVSVNVHRGVFTYTEALPCSQAFTGTCTERLIGWCAIEDCIEV